MRGEERRRPQGGRDFQRGTEAALESIYKPENAAQAAFDRLIDKLAAVPGTHKGGGDAQPH